MNWEPWTGWGDYFEKRRPLEVPGFTMAQGKFFHDNCRISMNDLFKEATRFENLSKSIGQPCNIDRVFLREFASKIEALSK